MDETPGSAAVVGIGAILPDAPDAPTFWTNVKQGRYSITEVPKGRWDPDLYYDPDPKAPDKTYSKIGGWVRDWDWDPLGWHLPIPPKVGEAMDDSQKWAVACAREALADYGYPGRPLDPERIAVILGNALAGEKHYLSALRIYFPEFAEELSRSTTFFGLPRDVQTAILEETHVGVGRRLPEITEDTMPGELANILAGRVANLLDFHGPNFITDAACASAMAAMSAAVKGLADKDFDAVVTGGIDRNMGPPAFVKFCKIGALSATGTRPYAEGADGFVMGEGAGVFLLKRLADAERDDDRIYAVIRSLAGSSDGRGKGIAAPNPIGQRLAVQWAWERAGLSPVSASLIEGHGTSTRVGDVVEVESLTQAFGAAGARPGSVALGSVKSNIGHLKAAAGAAGLLKTVLALSEKVLPPSLNFEHPNPDIDFEHSPFFVNTELRDWEVPAGEVRRAGVSAFGFGGTNFHAVLEEHSGGNGRRGKVATAVRSTVAPEPTQHPTTTTSPQPLRGALVLGAADRDGLAGRLGAVEGEARSGRAPTVASPSEEDLRAPERIAIDFADAAELAEKESLAAKALAMDSPAAWKALRARGIYRGSGAPPKVAFLYTGQGSQYVNMLASLRSTVPIAREVFDEADAVMTPLLGKPLSSYIFVDGSDTAAVTVAEADLMQTAITQPAVLAADLALTKLLSAYGIVPDMVMGHSLGEYGALVAAGSLAFDHALEAVSARGREMASISVEDNGWMAAVFAPLPEIERILASVDGYVVIANINSNGQAVIGGASRAVESAIAAFQDGGYQAVRLPVSHAFHTSIVAPASDPLREALIRLDLRPPTVPIVANVSGQFYPMGPDAVPEMLDILAAQVASPVQFVKGLRTLYEAGARVFVEVGPKKALQGFAEDVLGSESGVLTLFTNHPKWGDEASFNQALCGLYAAGLGSGAPAERVGTTTAMAAAQMTASVAPSQPDAAAPTTQDRDLEQLFGEFLLRARQLYEEGAGGVDRPQQEQPVVITGAALGLPGRGPIFDDLNVARILRGDQFIDVIPTELRRAMLDKHITRLVKPKDGDPTFEAIDSPDDVIKLAGRAGRFDLAEEFGIDPDRIEALEKPTQYAVAAGIDALRDAGIPMVMRYRTTSIGTKLANRWMLPPDVGEDTGVIFASAFPGCTGFAEEMSAFYTDRSRRERLEALEVVRDRFAEGDADGPGMADLEYRIHDLKGEIERNPYAFNRRFLWRALSMGHSQFAELIGARGPNTQVNSACASTTQAIALAEDWIRSGRCSRVVVVAADDATSDVLFEWIGAGFLASGAAATDDVVEDAATPFDRRRHGMIVGMGAAAIVMESAPAAAGRGMRPICEVLSSVTANSAFHGSRLDVEHIASVMERLVSQAEQRWGIDRNEIAPQTVFVSHETYTPARGGSAAAEVDALRQVFGPAADQMVVANTKGFTGHPMGVGIEDVVAVKALETGVVPPVPNFKEIDPDLGTLNLSKGGAYPIRYALRLAAGFGSQISMTLLRWVPSPDGTRRMPNDLGFDYRIADPKAWQSWLRAQSGQEEPELEVSQRRLQVKDRRPAGRAKHVEPTAEAVPAEVPEPPAESVPEMFLAAVPEPVTASPAEREAAAPIFVAEASEVPTEPSVLPVAAPEVGVEDAVLSLVAEKTGYPPDMLDLDLDLEADLGVDTVKQAEIFATIRESYGIAREDNLKLRDFPTLNHVIQFVRDRAPQPEANAVASAPAQFPEVPAVPIASAALPETPTELTAPLVAAPAVEDAVLALVAEKTGYPPDMLDLDLDLEADLGVDTVKQAEIFATIRESYGIAREDNLKLREFPTLNHVIQWVQDRSAAGSEPAVDVHSEEDGIPSAGTLTTATAAHAEDVSDRALAGLEAAGAVPRRVPVPVLRPPLDVCKTTGVALGTHSRVLLMPDRSGVAQDLAARLEEEGVRVLAIDDDPQVDAVRERVEGWAAEGSIQGVYWLPALDPEPAIDGMDLTAWRAGMRRRVKLLAATMRALSGQIGEAGTFLVAATRLGGHHGYDDEGALEPMGGAVTGFVKAFKRELPESVAKAIDVDGAAGPSAISAALIQETKLDPGVVEVGYRDGLRWSVGIEERSAVDGRPGMPLSTETVFVVTGAAGSIVSAIVADLAKASGGSFHLLDLAAPPDRDDPDLVRFAQDRDGLKLEIFERLKARGDRATPAMVERELAILERKQAALQAMATIEAVGGRAVYHQLDLTDPPAVAAVVEEIRRDHGRIDVLLHAAGLEISHFLPDKEQREFDLVFDVKADGWFNLLHAIGDMPLGAVVAFSSVAGRFGNAGQTDYSAANDLLCKSVSHLRSTRPETRAIAIDWTAWAGIGMASRGSIPKMMEAAGIDMLPPETGICVIRRELVSGGTSGEVLIGGRLGLLTREWDVDGGVDGEAMARSAAGPMIGRIEATGLYEGFRVEVDLDPNEQPFLDDHCIDGTPVLPGVMGIEGFAEVAKLALPGWHVAAIEDVRFLAPFKFYRSDPRTLTFDAVFRPDGDEVVATCRLTGVRTLPNQSEPQVTEHFTGRIRLSRRPAEPAHATLPEVDGAGSVSAGDIYSVYFHGPAYQVLEEAWPEASPETAVGRLKIPLPADHAPAGVPLAAAPRLIELCFQTAGLRELATEGRLALPLSVERIQVAAMDDRPRGPAFAVVTPSQDGGFDARVVDADGVVLVSLEGYRTVELPGTVDASRLSPLQASV